MGEKISTWPPKNLISSQKEVRLFHNLQKKQMIEITNWQKNLLKFSLMNMT